MSNKTLMFGVGAVYAGNIPFGIIQNVNLDISASVKELFGENKFAEAIGVATHSVTGSCSFASINSALAAKYMFGTDMQSGSYQRAEEYAIVPAASPYTYVPVNIATFVRNMSVMDTTTGIYLKLVTGAPATGEYSVDPVTGYTFNAAQADLPVKIVYDWSSDLGQNYTIANQRMGQQYPFTMVLANSFQDKTYMMTLYQCIFTKQSFQAKNDDFGVPQMDFSCFTNDAELLARFDFGSLT